MAKHLIATARVLHGNTQYERGAELPTDNAAFASELLEAGSAVWKDDDGKNKKKKTAKAKSVTAPVGAAGSAQPATGAETDLVGQVPSRRARGAVKEPSKRAPKNPA